MLKKNYPVKYKSMIVQSSGLVFNLAYRPSHDLRGILDFIMEWFIVSFSVLQNIFYNAQP